MCIPQQILRGCSIQAESDAWVRQHLWDIGDVYTGFLWSNQRESIHFETPGLNRKIILKLVFKK